MTAQQVVDQFGLRPKIVHSVGEPRSTPKGNLLDGVYERTYVSFPLQIKEHDSLEHFLLGTLEADFLKQA